MTTINLPPDLVAWIIAVAICWCLGYFFGYFFGRESSTSLVRPKGPAGVRCEWLIVYPDGSSERRSNIYTHEIATLPIETIVRRDFA